MSLSFGLNVNSKAAASSKAPAKPAKNASIFDDDFEDEGTRDSQDVGQSITDFNGTTSLSSTSQKARSNVAGAKPKPKSVAGPPSLKNKTQRVEYGDLSGSRASGKHATQAQELDPSVWDYDSFHDAQSSVTAAKKAAAKQDAVERKPKYMDNLLDAASRRKQDLLVAREKLLQKEREAEGDEFADKEKFVTGAYKAQQEEARKIEEEEKRKAEEDERRRKAGIGGMQGFYRGMMAEHEKKHQEAMEAAQKLEQGVRLPVEETEKSKTDAELAAELKAKGVDVYVNEEGQVADKRQLLSAGLNVAPSGTSGHGSADHLKTQAKSAQQGYQGRNRNDQRVMRERQTRMMEEQLAQSAKRAADEEAEEQRKVEHAAKSRKTDTDISSAKERYLARKREAEAAKKAG